MEIYDKDGSDYALDERLHDKIVHQPQAIAKVLALLIEKAVLTRAELIDCDILIDGEFLDPEECRGGF